MPLLGTLCNSCEKDSMFVSSYHKMDTNVIPETTLTQSRLNKINEISNALKECDKVIEELSEKLQWDKKQMFVKQNIKRVQCPFNEHHVMNSGDLDNHIHKCRMKQMGFTECESSSKFYDTASSVVSVTTDITTKDNDRDPPIPSEYHAYMFTPEERLSQYDNDVKVLSLPETIKLNWMFQRKVLRWKRPDKSPSLETSSSVLLFQTTSSKRKAERDQLESDLNESTQDTKETTSGNQRSELEILAEQRDYKRRRQSFRAKNVHITKRTPIEITREIINNRMQELLDIYQETKKASSPS